MAKCEYKELLDSLREFQANGVDILKVHRSWLCRECSKHINITKYFAEKGCDNVIR